MMFYFTSVTHDLMASSMLTQDFGYIKLYLSREHHLFILTGCCITREYIAADFSFG